MSEQPGRMPKLDEWAAAIDILATDLNLRGPNDAREQPQTVTASNSRKHSPSGITSGSPLRESSSDSASGPQASTQVSSQASTEVSTFPSLSPFPSIPFSIITSHHHSSSSSSTIRPPKTYLDLAPGYYSGSFELYAKPKFSRPPGPGLWPQYTHPFEAMSQVHHNPSGFADQFNSGKYHLAPLCHDHSTNCTITIVTV